MTSTTFDPNAFEADLTAALERSKIAFKAKYAKQLNELSGLSRSDIDAISPGITNLQKYDELIELVKSASQHNLDQAALKSRIVAMGEIAVKIAKKVPSLATMLV